MELLQLQYFLKLARMEHVTKTADFFHISQPSLSLTIKKLEEELGVPLFVRVGRNIVLSEYGKIYLDYVETALDLLANGQRVLDAKTKAKDNRLSLGLASPYIWNDLLQSFMSRYPDIEMNRYSLEGNDYVEALQNKTIDIYIGGLNFFNGKGLATKTLYTDQMILLVNKKHPFAKLESIDLSQCSGECFINLNKSANLQQLVSSMYQSAGFTPSHTIECDYTLRDQMVDQNYGISITTLRSASESKLNNIKAVKIKDSVVRRVLGLVWIERLSFTPALKKFFDFACEYYACDN